MEKKSRRQKNCLCSLVTRFTLQDLELTSAIVIEEVTRNNRSRMFRMHRVIKQFCHIAQDSSRYRCAQTRNWPPKSK